MLVLLIIFMVAAPLSTVDLPVESADLDRDAAEEAGQTDLCQHQAGSVGRDRRELVKRVDLVRSLDAMDGVSKDQPIFLRSDRAVPYGELMDVLEILRAGGYSRIKLVALEGVPDAAQQGAPAAPKP